MMSECEELLPITQINGVRKWKSKKKTRLIRIPYHFDIYLYFMLLLFV